MSVRGDSGTWVNILHSLSAEAEDLLFELNDPALTRVLPEEKDVASWSKLRELFECYALPGSDLLVERFAPAFAGFSLGGVPVLDVRPRNWKERSKVAIYMHGGGFALYSAASTLGRAALFADDTDLRVISVDYALAPPATFEEIRNQVVTVFRALLSDGYRPADTVMVGDSSGGALVVAVILELCNLGPGLPAAAVLISPSIDFVPAKSTAETSRASFVTERSIAETAGEKEPRLSRPTTSIAADFSKGFSPTLIQGSKKELLLSQFFGLYRALDLAGVAVELDLYEGMPQGFQFRSPDALESKLARQKIRDFVLFWLAREVSSDRNGRAMRGISNVAGKKSGKNPRQAAEFTVPRHPWKNSLNARGTT